jgi:hypothetical protein
LSNLNKPVTSSMTKGKRKSTRLTTTLCLFKPKSSTFADKFKNTDSKWNLTLEKLLKLKILNFRPRQI